MLRVENFRSAINLSIYYPTDNSTYFLILQFSDITILLITHDKSSEMTFEVIFGTEVLLIFVILKSYFVYRNRFGCTPAFFSPPNVFLSPEGRYVVSH